MPIDIEKHIALCFSCAQTKSNRRTAPILECPLSDGPLDVLGLLQLPRSSQGFVYILVCVDHFSLFFVLAPFPNKSETILSHAIVSYMICPYTIPRLLLSGNGTEFKNQVFADICT